MSAVSFAGANCAIFFSRDTASSAPAPPSDDTVDEIVDDTEGVDAVPPHADTTTIQTSEPLIER
jgi:hypothetical protein